MKLYKMTHPEIFRNNSFNRCRHCGQYFEQDEEYYFKCMNGNKLQYEAERFCIYKIENFYIHKLCFDKYYKDFTEDNFIFNLFNSSYPKAKNKLTEKQIKLAENVKMNCKILNYSYKEKTKYIYIDGKHNLKNSYISIKGKYNKIEMKFEPDEKGFNFKYLTQNAYLHDLLKDNK